MCGSCVAHAGRARGGRKELPVKQFRHISVEDPIEAAPLCSKIALTNSVEDPLEAAPLCSKVALANSVEDPLEAPPLYSMVALANSVEDPLEASPLCSKVAPKDSITILMSACLCSFFGKQPMRGTERGWLRSANTFCVSGRFFCTTRYPFLTSFLDVPSVSRRWLLQVTGETSD